MKAKQNRLGDYVKIATQAVGIPTCQGCERRAQKLNEFHEKWLSLTSPMKKEADSGPAGGTEGR